MRHEPALLAHYNSIIQLDSFASAWEGTKNPFFIKSLCFKKSCLKRFSFCLLQIACAIASFSILLRFNASGGKRTKVLTQQLLIIFKCISQHCGSCFNLASLAPGYYLVKRFINCQDSKRRIFVELCLALRRVVLALEIRLNSYGH